MIFERPNLGRFVGILIFVLGYLTSNCLASSELLILCEEVDEAGSSPNLATKSKNFISIENFSGDVSCKDILYEGKYHKHSNEDYRFRLIKKEITGFNCTFNGTIEETCVGMYQAQSKFFGIICEPWAETKEAKAIKLAEIPGWTETITSDRFSWNLSINKSYVLECDTKNKPVNSSEFQSLYKSQFIHLTLSVFSPIPVCSILIVEPVKRLKGWTSDSSYPIIRFTLRKESDYVCNFGDFEGNILGEDTETFSFEIHGEFIYCKEKNLEEILNIETNSIIQNDLITCEFANFHKGSNDKFMYRTSKKRPFIYIIQNENREKPDCFRLIKGGNVKNYGNILLEFTLNKIEVSGFECYLDDPIIIKENPGSLTVLTNFTGLICGLAQRNSRDSPMIIRTIECDFHDIILENTCKKRNIISKALIIAQTDDEELTCFSLIVDAKVDVKNKNTVQFRLYKPEFSGYICDLELDEIKKLKPTWLLIRRTFKTLNCIKQRRITKLACRIMGITPSYVGIWPTVKINVKTKKSVQCADILMFGTAESRNFKTEKYEKAILMIIHESVSGFKCDLRSEGIQIIRSTEHNHRFQVDIEKKINCKDFVSANPESHYYGRTKRELKSEGPTASEMKSNQERIQSQNKTESNAKIEEMGRNKRRSESREIRNGVTKASGKENEKYHRFTIENQNLNHTEPIKQN